MQEEMVGLYHSVDSTLSGIERKSLLFIGSQEKEGTSTVSEQFAKVASQIFGKSVLLLKAGKPHTVKPGKTANEAKGGQSSHHQPNEKSAPKTLHGDSPDQGIMEGEPDHSLDVPLGRTNKNPGSSEKILIPNPSELHNTAIGNIPTIRTFHPAPHSDGYQTASLANVGPSLSAVFSSPGIFKFLDFLKEQYEIIIIDAPPLSLTLDGLASAGKVDGAVIVVEAERTRWHLAANTIKKIEKAGGTALGVVLNKQKYYIPPGIYNRL